MALSTRAWRRIALALAAVLALLLAALLVGFWLFVRIPREATSLPLPPELASAGTLDGEGLLVREELFRDERLGLLTDLATGASGERIVVGRRGAAFVGPDWELLRYVPFSTRTTHVEVVDVEGDGSFEFLNRGGSGWADASLLGSDGSVRWTIGGMPGLNDVGHGDLDADGLLDFVGGYNGFGGIRGISREGDDTWRQSGGNIWHVELAAVDDVPGDEILHSDAQGTLTIRGADGSVATRHALPFYVSHFTLVPWPAVGDPLHVVDAQGGFV